MNIEKITPAGLSVERPKDHPDWVSAETVLQHNMEEYRRLSQTANSEDKQIFEELSRLCEEGLRDVKEKIGVETAIVALDEIIRRTEEVTSYDSDAVSLGTLGVGNQQRAPLLQELSSLRNLRDQLKECALAKAEGEEPVEPKK